METAVDIFNNKENFEHAQRVAIALSKSSMIPTTYQGDRGIPNTIVALEMAHRIGMSPFMVMQNLHVIQGRPSWSSTFLIAAINTCGKFEPIKFRMEGQGDNRSCVAWTKDKSGEILESPKVDMEMAKAEGWLQKNGSKWKTMPELMLRYRAASFFSRLYAPEIAMGMHTDEELLDGSISKTEIVNDLDLTKLIELPNPPLPQIETEKDNIETSVVLEPEVREEKVEYPKAPGLAANDLIQRLKPITENSAFVKFKKDSAHMIKTFQGEDYEAVKKALSIKEAELIKNTNSN